MDDRIEYDINHSDSNKSLDFETGIYFICKGEVLILNSSKNYDKYSENEQQHIDEWKQKYTLK